MHVSLRHRRTKLWLSLSAKQRQDPSSGPTAVYQDLSMHHNNIGPLKSHCRFADQDERKFEMHFL